MGVTLETIRKITIQGSTQGVAEAAAALNTLSSAQGRLASASNATATVTDLASKRQLSAAEAYRRQTLAVDEGARAQDRIAKATRIADAALQQGIITQGEHSRRLEDINQKYSQATKGVGAFGGALGGATQLLGAFGIALSGAAVVQFLRGIFDSTAALNEQAEQIGVSVEGLQAYRAELGQVGLSTEQVDQALTKYNRNVGEAVAGTGRAHDAFLQLGMTARDLAGGTEASLPKTAAALLSIQDSAVRAALEVDLFGKTGQKLESALRSLLDPTSTLIEKNAALGLVLGRDVTTGADKASDAIARFMTQVKNLTALGIYNVAVTFSEGASNPAFIAAAAQRHADEAAAAGNAERAAAARTSGIPFSSAAGASNADIVADYQARSKAIAKIDDDRFTAQKEAAKKAIEDEKTGIDEIHKKIADFEASEYADELKRRALIENNQALHRQDLQEQLDGLTQLHAKKADAAASDQRALEYLSQTQVYGKPNEARAAADRYGIEEANAYLQVLERVNEQTRTAAASMAEAFGSVGQAVGDLSVIMSDYAVQQQAIEEKRIANGKRLGDETKADAIASRERAQLEIQYNGDMIGAAKGFFSEKSAIYKGLQAAETVYRAIQMAGAIQSIVMGTAETTAVVANAGAQATAYAVTAEAHTAASVPFPYNLAAMAAVAAALIAAGVSLGNSGGAGAAPGETDTADRQKAAGVGTVLGDSSGKSTSISKALEQAQKNADSQLEYSSQMVTSLKSIESNIGSLTNLIARNLGVSGGSFDTGGLGLGSTHSSFNPPLLAEGYLSSALGFSLSSTNTTKSLQDFGLKFSDQTLGSIATGILGNVYQQVLTSSSTNFLGIKVSSSKSNATVDSALNADLSNQIAKVIDSLKSGIVSAATALGVTGASATLDSFKVALGTLSFKDLTGAQIQEQLNAVFGKLGDQLSAELIPALTGFQNAGEGAFETLVRLAREYQIVDVTMASMGKTFDAVGLASLAARDSLVQMAGGLDAFTSQAKFFAENFLSPEQQLAPVINAVAMEMARLGEGAIKTKDQFAALVLGLDVSTQSGAQLYSSLMAVAPAFAHVADAVTDAISKVTSSIDSLISASESSAAAYRQASKAIGDTLNQLRSGTANLAASLAVSRSKFATGVGAARSGDLTALNALPKLAQDFATASLANSSTIDAYRGDLIGIMGDLASAGTTADQQASLYDVQTGILEATKANLSQAQIDTVLLQQQLAALGQVGDLVGAGNGAVVQQLQFLIQLQAQLADAAIAGGTAAAAPVAATVAASQAAVIAPVALTGTQLAMQLGPIDQLYKGHNTKLMDVQQGLIAGNTITNAQWAQAGLPPGGNLHYYAAGGDFGSGWARVGEQGPEIVKFGAPGRVFSNAQSRALVDNSDLIAEVKTLARKMENMRAASEETAKNTRAIESFFRTISEDGNSINTKAV